MVYADYEYYMKSYLGIALGEADFVRLATRASAYIDYITRGDAKSKAREESVKNACCAVAEAWSKAEQGGVVISESVGSWHKTFSQTNNRYLFDLFDAAKIHLLPAGFCLSWGWC